MRRVRRGDAELFRVIAALIFVGGGLVVVGNAISFNGTGWGPMLPWIPVVALSALTFYVAGVAIELLDRISTAAEGTREATEEMLRQLNEPR